VLVQVRQYVRSDESGCAGEYYVHGLAASCVSKLELVRSSESKSQ
jgi:hypothetical protein